MNDISPYLERAQLLLAQGRANDAIAQLKNALQQDPGSDEALSLYARCQFAQKDYEAGIATINNAISIDPENSYYFYLLGFGYYSANKNKMALEAFKQSQEMDPYFAETYGLMAHVYIEQKDFNKGLATANEGLEIDPENITCLNARSIALNKMHKTDDAINTMQNALAQDPDNEYTHCTVGWNYLEKGQHKIATKHFKEALRINPNMHNAQAGLKEALKSKIAPYRWLLRYSFWINNKGKKMRWIIPLGLYLTVRLLSSLLKMKDGTEYIAGSLIALYFLFILTSWLITPLANFFLLFHKDGKYALTQTEKKTAVTVVAALLAGLICLCVSQLIATEYKNIVTGFIIATAAFWAMSVPLGNIEYPLSVREYGTQNKIAMLLVLLALVTIPFAFIYLPVAIFTGISFIVIFVLNNWAGIFR